MLARLFRRKRKIGDDHDMPTNGYEAVEPVRLQFLFVGGKEAGQTALLL